MRGFFVVQVDAMARPWSPYRQIVVETFRGPDRGHHGSIRARPIPGEIYPTTMRVSCSKPMRTSHPVGTQFRIYAKLTDREGGPPFLYSGPDWPYEIVK